MIIGIVGYNLSGKDTAAEILEKMGFTHYSLSNIIRDELKKEGKELTRENLIKKGVELREEFGIEVLADRITETIKQDIKNQKQDFVITSIRHPTTIKLLRERFSNFRVLHVEADEKIRYQRLIGRNRGEKDASNFEEFIRIENLERKNTDPNKQSIQDCVEVADYIIINEETIEELKYDVQKLVEQIRNEVGEK
ncbi:AAA family ATPase [Candidatus Micrarchaeota archaeon]|nr:AAA family ATPase [Candidatus Micrarchaeota archaeon]